MTAMQFALPRRAAAEGVHDVLHGLIKTYSDAAKAGMSNQSVAALLEQDGFRD